MSKQQVKSYSAEFKERAVKLAVESDQSVAQTARDLGVNENTLIEISPGGKWRPGAPKR